MRCLLDKVTARYAIQGLLKLAESRSLTVAFDQPMINHWSVEQTAIQKRFTAMKNEFPSPYCHTSLPEILRPEQINV